MFRAHEDEEKKASQTQSQAVVKGLMLHEMVNIFISERWAHVSICVQRAHNLHQLTHRR